MIVANIVAIVLNAITLIITTVLKFWLAKKHQEQIKDLIKKQQKQVKLGKEYFREEVERILLGTLKNNNGYEVYRVNEAFGIIDKIRVKKLGKEERKFKSEEKGIEETRKSLKEIKKLLEKLNKKIN